MPTALRRLFDLPGVADLERAAVMKPLPGIGETPTPDADVDACCEALFGLTPAQAQVTPRPSDWDGVEDRPLPRQVAAFEDAGWDVTDNKRRPLRVLVHLAAPLWLAVRGVAGHLPPDAQDRSDEDEGSRAWGSEIEAEASRFRKR